MPLVKLTDVELDCVLAAARPIPVDRRDAFLQQVAAELQGRELGPGVVYRVCAEAQRQFYDVPEFTRSAGAGKYR